jgi:hypothetical protein
MLLVVGGGCAHQPEVANDSASLSEDALDYIEYRAEVAFGEEIRRCLGEQGFKDISQEALDELAPPPSLMTAGSEEHVHSENRVIELLHEAQLEQGVLVGSLSVSTDEVALPSVEPGTAGSDGNDDPQPSTLQQALHGGPACYQSAVDAHQAVISESGLFVVEPEDVAIPEEQADRTWQPCATKYDFLDVTADDAAYGFFSELRERAISSGVDLRAFNPDQMLVPVQDFYLTEVDWHELRDRQDDLNEALEECDVG